MGRVEVDLRELAREVSHNLWRPIKDGEGSLNIIITITATSKADSPSNLANWNPEARHEQQLEEKYVRILPYSSLLGERSFTIIYFLEAGKHFLQHERHRAPGGQDHEGPGSPLRGYRGQERPIRRGGDRQRPRADTHRAQDALSSLAEDILLVRLFKSLYYVYIMSAASFSATFGTSTT